MRTRGQTLDNQALHRPLQPCNKNHGYECGEGRILASCRLSGNDRGNKGRSEEDADDVRLMRLIGRGDTIALEELIEKHQALVAGTVARMLGSNSDVEDIAQQVFIRVWKSARRYVPRAKFTTWLLKITRNLVFN